MSSHEAAPQLSSSNYHQWSLDMQQYLNRHAVGLIISGDWIEPVPADSKAGFTPEERRELLSFKQHRSKAAGLIYGAIPADLRVHLDGVDANDALGMWDKLKKTFVKQNSTSRFHTLDQLLRVQLGPEEGLTEYAGRTHRLREQFKQLLPDGYKVSELLDDLEINSLLHGLPSTSTHSTLAETLWLQSDLTRDDVLNKFAAHERKLSSDAIKTEGAMAASASTRCFRCDQFGHMADSCPFKEEFKKLVEKTQQQKQGGGSGRRHQRPKKRANQASEAQQEEAAKASTPSIIPSSDSHWNTDTGSSSHMTPHRKWFNTYRSHIVPIRLANRSVVFSAGIGSVSIQPDAKKGSNTAVMLHNVLHVPSLGSNLLSVFSLTCKDGYIVYIEGNTVRFLRDKELKFTATVNERNIGYVNGKTLSADEVATVAEDIAEEVIEEIADSNCAEEYANAASTCSMDLTLWHRRCSHLNHRDVSRMVSKRLVKGMRVLDKSSPDPICEPCLSGKQHRHDIPRGPSSRTPRRLLSLVHTDVKGPLPVQSIEGYRYWVTFIDDKSRHWAVYGMKHKSEVFAKFKEYKAEVENQLDCKIQALQDDGGGEYISNEMKDFKKKEGIVSRTTETNEPHQNGVAERANRDIIDGIVTLLTEAKLPPYLWYKALKAFVHTRNRTPSSALNGRIPYTIFHGQKPDINHFRVFGCASYVLIRKEKRTALQSHSRKCIFIGYPAGTKAWEFWDAGTKKVISTSHVHFDERVMPGNSVEALGALFNPPPDLPTVEITPDSPDLLHQGGDRLMVDEPNDDFDDFLRTLPIPGVVEPPAAVVEAPPVVFGPPVPPVHPPPPVPPVAPSPPPPPIMRPPSPSPPPPPPGRSLRPQRAPAGSMNVKALERSNAGPAIASELRIPAASILRDPPHPYRRPSTPVPSRSPSASPSPFSALPPPIIATAPLVPIGSPSPDPLDILGDQDEESADAAQLLKCDVLGEAFAFLADAAPEGCIDYWEVLAASFFCMLQQDQVM